MEPSTDGRFAGRTVAILAVEARTARSGHAQAG
jgi:hypothetical protein